MLCVANVGGLIIAKPIITSKESIGIKQGSRMAIKELDYLLKRYSEIVADVGEIETIICSYDRSFQKLKRSHKRAVLILQQENGENKYKY